MQRGIRADGPHSLRSTIGPLRSACKCEVITKTNGSMQLCLLPKITYASRYWRRRLAHFQPMHILLGPLLQRPPGQPNYAIRSRANECRPHGRGLEALRELHPLVRGLAATSGYLPVQGLGCGCLRERCPDRRAPVVAAKPTAAWMRSKPEMGKAAMRRPLPEEEDSGVMMEKRWT